MITIRNFGTKDKTWYTAVEDVTVDKTSESNGLTTLGHANFERFVSSSVLKTKKISVNADIGSFGVSFDVDNPAVNISPEGVIESDISTLGYFEISNGLVRERIPFSTSLENSSDDFYQFISFRDGSVAKTLNDLMQVLTANETPDRRMFIGDSWNPNFWAYSQRSKLCAISKNPTGRARVKITPRHMVGTAHANFQLSIGQNVNWLDQSNVMRTASVIGKSIRHTETEPTLDLAVYTLSNETPEIPICKLPPALFYNEASESIRRSSDYFAFSGEGAIVPLFQPHKDNQCAVIYHDGWSFRRPNDDTWPYDGLVTLYMGASSLSVNTPLVPDAYAKAIASGTSGNPTLGILGDDVVLLGLVNAVSTIYYANAVDPGVYRDLIDTMIAEADADAGANTGLTAQTVNLSGFTDFS